jgi:hypothetical protein
MGPMGPPPCAEVAPPKTRTGSDVQWFDITTKESNRAGPPLEFSLPVSRPARTAVGGRAGGRTQAWLTLTRKRAASPRPAHTRGRRFSRSGGRRRLGTG